jgi:hypothetical protein
VLHFERISPPSIGIFFIIPTGIKPLFTSDIFGISDHDLMFSQEPDDTHEEVDEGHNNYIESRVCFQVMGN